MVETINLRLQQGQQSPFPTSPDAVWIERFTRTARGALAYHVDVIDPAVYTRPWTVDYVFRPTPRVWEYACHEGNYGMEHILSGARRVEHDAATGKPTRP